ncbi:phage major capsid protein [Agrobacterium rhizogenes]|uniref:phage major capsid protein n=1 Tax=Rhizobium rhizogenes TaxID=359 RepID=UPI0015732BF1|nr:phage major capsid protein [Rhizobium rhizogenes]NTF80840.1 phage major capsid protein [Rhizobium rhizogenes]NTI01899.1 phage major capsid protein [Rhizobium rhizogenes]NTI08702.1 phage major capsid protein [Rhizobium rhizogenes]
MADDTKDLLKQVSNELVRVSDEFTKKAEEAMREVRNAGKLSDETKAVVDEMAVKQTTLNGIVEELKARLAEVEQKSVRRTGGDEAAARSVGQQLVADAKLKDFAKSVQAGQRISVPVKNATTSPDIAPGVVEPQRLPGIDVMPKQRLFIRDLISPGTTTSPAIFWVQQTGFVNNAAAVAENTKKPESSISFDTKITPVATIAHLFKASKQILDDFAQLASTVDAELRYGLKYAEERELLFGSGVGVHLEGIVPQAQAYAPAFTVDMQTPIDDLRLAMLQTQLARLPASGFVLHFIDWAKIELTKDANGQYILANPLRLASPTLWGLPVVATDVPEFQGEFLTGAFQAGAQLFDREDANVVISTENNDDFEKNMVTVRCEERLALALKRPEAFVTGPFSY